MQTLTTLLQSAPPLVLALVKATLVLAIVQLLVGALTRVSAATRHVLLVMGITGFLLFPLFSLVLPAWELPVLPEAQAAAITPAQDDVRFFPSSANSTPTNETVTVAAPRLDGNLDGNLIPAPATSAGPAATADSRRPVNWMAITLYAWMTVALLLLSRVLLGLIRVGWIIRTAQEVSRETGRLAQQARSRLALNREVRLLASDFVEVPMICGFFKPTVLLPSTIEEWPEDQLETVLLHEFAHLKRWDAMTLLLTNLVTSLFWFHPQVWFASLSTRRECERACDDLVLTTGTKPSDYAGHLLSIVKLMPDIERFGAVSLAMSQRSQLEGRLLAILHPSLRRGSVDGRAVTAAIVSAALLVMPIAAARLIARETIHSDAVLLASLNPSGIPESSSSEMTSNDETTSDEDQKDYDKDEDKDWYSRGYELHHKGRFAEARAAFMKSMEQGRREEASMYNIACGYALENQSDQAMAWLNRAIDAGFDSYDHLFEDSDLASLQDDPRFQALQARYRKDYDEEKHQSDKDDLEEAREDLDSLRRDGSTDGEEWHQVGKELLSLRQLDDAIEAISLAVKHLGYDNENAQYNLACAYALKGDRQQALQWLERAINNGFDDPGHLRRDPDLVSLRSTPRFQELAKLADELSLDGRQSRLAKDEPQYSKRRWASTIQHFDNYVKSNPQSGRAWFNLGYALHYSSEHDRAINAFQQAMRHGYRQPTSMYNIACGYAKLGQSANAIEWLERSDKAGFKLQNYIFGDEDLESLHDNPRFLALAARVAADHGIEKISKKFKKTKKST